MRGDPDGIADGIANTRADDVAYDVADEGSDCVADEGSDDVTDEDPHGMAYRVSHCQPHAGVRARNVHAILRQTFPMRAVPARQVQ